MDLGRYFIGDSISYPIPRKKEWVNAAIGAAVALGSTLYGANKSAEAERKAEKLGDLGFRSQYAYGHLLSEQKLKDNAIGQSISRQQHEISEKNFKKANAQAKFDGNISGLAETQKADNDREAKVAENMANISSERQIEGNKIMANALVGKAQADAQSERTRGANTAKAASDMGNAVGGAISSLESAKSTGASLSDSQKADINQYYVKNPDEWSQTKKSVLGGTDAAVGTEEYKKNQEKLFGVKM